MSAYRHQSLVTSSVRTQREATSVPAPADTFYRKMERAAEVTHTKQIKTSKYSKVAYIKCYSNQLSSVACSWIEGAALVATSSRYLAARQIPPLGQ